MQIQNVPMRCKCGHEWLGDMLIDVPIDLAVASLRATRCPDCHADWHSIAFVTKPAPAGD